MGAVDLAPLFGDGQDGVTSPGVTCAGDPAGARSSSVPTVRSRSASGAPDHQHAHQRTPTHASTRSDSAVDQLEDLFLSRPHPRRSDPIRPSPFSPQQASSIAWLLPLRSTRRARAAFPTPSCAPSPAPGLLTAPPSPRPYGATDADDRRHVDMPLARRWPGDLPRRDLKKISHFVSGQHTSGDAPFSLTDSSSRSSPDVTLGRFAVDAPRRTQTRVSMRRVRAVGSG